MFVKCKQCLSDFIPIGGQRICYECQEKTKQINKLRWNEKRRANREPKKRGRPQGSVNKEKRTQNSSNSIFGWNKERERLPSYDNVKVYKCIFKCNDTDTPCYSICDWDSCLLTSIRSKV